MEENKYVCPVCLSSKKYFNGRRYKDCKVCDEEGNVDKKTNDIYTGEEDLI